MSPSASWWCRTWLQTSAYRAKDEVLRRHLHNIPIQTSCSAGRIYEGRHSRPRNHLCDWWDSKTQPALRVAVLRPSFNIPGPECVKHGIFQEPSIFFPLWSQWWGMVARLGRTFSNALIYIYYCPSRPFPSPEPVLDGLVVHILP